MCYCTPSIRTPYCHNCYDYMRDLIDDLRERLSDREGEVLDQHKELLTLRAAIEEIEKAEPNKYPIFMKCNDGQWREFLTVEDCTNYLNESHPPLSDEPVAWYSPKQGLPYGWTEEPPTDDAVYLYTKKVQP
jgi:hypothetical protein